VSISIHLGFRGLPIHGMQVRATWAPTQGVCHVLHTESTKKTIFVVLVSDVVLLLTMLAGLLRLRLHGPMLGLGQFLWKQVGSGPSSTLIAYFVSCERV
jgi:hypothetical protein